MRNPYQALGNASAKITARVVASLMDRLQDFPPGEQAQGVGVVFLALCGELGINPREALPYSERMVSLEDLPEFRACRQYLDEEVRERSSTFNQNVAHYEAIKESE